MKRFLTRHMSLRRRAGEYSLLSSSDSQLNRTLHEDAEECDRSEDVDISNTTRSVSQRRRRWYRLSRRRTRRESEVTVVQGESNTLSTEANEDFEIAVEVSPCNDEQDTYTGHASLARHVSTSLLDVRNTGEDLEQYAPLNTTVNEHFTQILAPHTSGLKPTHLQSRRFAICEELERDLIMEDGVNLRKSRKNLVIRQVLHDLLLL